jgi:hypothetical protein
MSHPHTANVAPEHTAYSPWDLAKAVNIAAFLGWLFIAGPMFWNNINLIGFAAGFGLPIAYLACWVVGAPILKRVMRNPISWKDAAVSGAITSFSIAAVGIAIARFSGWLRSLNPQAYSQIGGGEFVISVNGILTPYGWWVLMQYTAAFVCMGIIVALIVRGIIGGGSKG